MKKIARIIALGLTAAACNLPPEVVDMARPDGGATEDAGSPRLNIPLDDSGEGVGSGHDIPTFTLPYPAGYAYPCTQGAHGGISHHFRENQYGLDFDTPNNTDERVVASTDGIARVGRLSPGYGNYVCIDRGDGTCYLVGHLERVDVFDSASLRSGNNLGIEGTTGDSSGCHIHTQLSQGDPGVDPGDNVSILFALWVCDLTSGSEEFVRLTSEQIICGLPGGHEYLSNTVEMDIAPAGRFRNGWHYDGTSRQIWNTYLIKGYVRNGENSIGVAIDNGGGEWVHEWDGVLVQDFVKPIPPLNIGHWSMIAYNAARNRAYLLKGGFRYLCLEMRCLTFFGAPRSNERPRAAGGTIQEFDYGRMEYDGGSWAYLYDLAGAEICRHNFISGEGTCLGAGGPEEEDPPFCPVMDHEEICDGRDNDCDGETDEDLARVCESDCGSGVEECRDGEWRDCSAPLPQLEVCNNADDDCDGSIDEGVRNACGGCGPVPSEVCDYADNDCDGAVDEGVRNRCGSCGSVPTEVCNGIDDDCDGSVDDGVGNACGFCGPVPAEECGNGLDENCNGEVNEGCPLVCVRQDEVCDYADNDCDGLVDEGVRNACGDCGPVPMEFCGNGIDENCNGIADDGCAPPPLACVAEVCDYADNDCDGRIDNGVRNACGGCGPVPSEVCDYADNDCDGQIDEGFRNACNRCGEVPAEVCGDSADNDCDGAVDEDCAPPPPPPGCGHTVRLRYNPGVDGVLNTDMPDNAGWYSYTISGGAIDITFTCVPTYEARVNARLNGPYENACGEWPEGVFQIPYGTPEAWVDGVSVWVEARHDPRMRLGCNFFIQIGSL